MTNYANFDRSKFPIVVVKFTGVEQTDDNFAAYLNGLYDNYNSKQPFSLVCDATNAPKPNITYQKRQAQWMKEHESLIKTYCKGIAYVMPNALYRIALMVIFSLQNNPVPFKVFQNVEDGVEWAKKMNTSS